MKKFFLSFFVLSMAMLAWANPSGNFHVTKALIHYESASFKFAGGEEWTIDSGEDEYAWDCDVTIDSEGNCTLFNLLGYEETLTGTYDAAGGTLVLPAQSFTVEDEEGDYELSICGGIKGYTDAQSLMDYLDTLWSYVTTKVLEVTLQYDQVAKTISLGSPILTYTPTDAYAGYVGYAYCVYSELVMVGESSGVTITVNEADGVRVIADLEEETIDVEFEDGSANIEGAQYIRIYSNPPYRINSVEVNGEATEAMDEGEYYFIEITEDVETIAISVEEIPVVNMTMMVYVEGLDNFASLYIMTHAGETGNTLATKETLAEGILNNVDFTNFDLPLQIYGTWADGTDYQMEVTIDGNTVAPAMAGPTSAQYLDVVVENDSFLTITLKGEEAIEASTSSFHVNKALIHYESSSFKFAGGEQWGIDSPEDEYAWDCEVTVNPDGTATLFNLLGYEETLTGSFNLSEGTLVLPVQNFTVEDEEGDYELAICGGIKGYTDAQSLMDYLDTLWSYVTTKVLDVTLICDVDTRTISLGSPILTYTPTEDYAGYVGYAYSVYSELLLAQEQTSQEVTITVNIPDGVEVYAENDEDKYLVEFEDGKAEVEDAQFITIYNADPYRIESVEVNGEKVEALEEGAFYFIEVSEDIKTIAINVEEVEIQQMTMMVYVEGLDNFSSLYIMDRYGETGKKIATKETLEEGILNNVDFTNLDLPLQIYGTWADGTDYKMTVNVDGYELYPVQEGPTSALFMDVNVYDDAFLSITLRSNETDLYLRGGMNGWGISEEYKFTKSVNEFGQTIFTLTGVEFEAYTEFKLADADWSAYNFGGEDWDALVPANEPVVLYDNGTNLKVDYYVNKDMVFTFNLATMTLLIEGDPNAYNPNLTEKTIYLRGEMNGWGADESYRFTTEDNILYTLTGVAFGEGVQFKIADADWGEVNIGANDSSIAISANEDYQTYYGGPNMVTNFDVVKEDVIEFNIITRILCIRTNSSAIQTINADSTQSKWYNLQGIEVNKAQLLPGNIYINNGQKVLVK